MEQESRVDNIGKEIEQLGVHNLELMKIIMSKKVINNDYIYEQIVDNNALEQHLHKLNQLHQ